MNQATDTCGQSPAEIKKNIDTFFRGKFVDRTGIRYGKLEVIEVFSVIRNPRGKWITTWRCMCDCGFETLEHNLPLVYSCGCSRLKSHLTKRERYILKRIRILRAPIVKKSEREKARIRVLAKGYRQRPEYRKYNAEYKLQWKKKRRAEDPVFRMRELLQMRIRRACFRNVKTGKTMELTGCTMAFLKSHLESQFKPGMSWRNYGKGGWEIDHKLPCASFDLSKPEEQRACFSWRNLQPLWKRENAAKGAKILDQIAA